MATDSESWFSFTSTRVSRRTVLRGGLLGGVGLAAAALIGCGDDDDDDDDAATQTATATATAAAGDDDDGGDAGVQRHEFLEPTVRLDGNPGGVYRLPQTGPPSSLHPFQTRDHRTKGLAAAVYGAPLAPVGRDFENAPSPDVQPNLIESWEQSPDGQMFTLNVRTNANFGAPVNRRVDAEDVVFSFNHVLGREGLEAAPEAGQLEMVDTVSAPDENTVVVTTSQPFGRFLNRLADVFTINVVPREAGTGLDISQPENMAAWGPFTFDADSFDPEGSWTTLRNPDWWGGPTLPWLDSITNTIVPSSATRMTQFRAGNLDSPSTINPEEIPDLAQTDNQVYLNKSLGWGFIAFGDPSTWRGTGDSPWSDVRVRRALALGLDRDLLNDVVYNIEKVEGAGISVRDKIGWHGVLPANFPGQSVDPRTDPNGVGKWIRFDPAEGQKLLAAAGAEGFSAPFHFTTIYGAGWALEAELLPQMLNENLGLNLEVAVDDYASEYVTGTFLGKFDGLAFILKAFPDLTEYLSEFSPGSSDNHSGVDDPALFAKANEIQAILDADERNAALKTFQSNELAEAMWHVSGVNWQITYNAHPADLVNLEHFLLARGGRGPVSWPYLFFDPARA